VAVLLRRIENRFVGTQDAAEYSGIPAGTLRAWRCQGVGPKFYKPRGRALYDVADLDEFIRSGIRVSSVRASKEERNVYAALRVRPAHRDDERSELRAEEWLLMVPST
jgi:DNA-binding transcriptional MerR regulator